jgi:hypothetical protein
MLFWRSAYIVSKGFQNESILCSRDLESHDAVHPLLGAKQDSSLGRLGQGQDLRTVSAGYAIKGGTCEALGSADF